MTKFFRLDENTKDSFKRCFISAMSQNLEDIAEIFNNRTWGIVVSEEPVFVTGDFPIGLLRGTCSKRNFGYGTKGTEVIYPLSPTKLLLMSDEFASDGLIYPLEDVGNLNHGICGASTRFIFSVTDEIPGVTAYG